VLDELFELGFDMSMRLNHYLTVDEAIQTEIVNLEKDTSFIPYYTQLVNFIGAIFNDCQGLMSPIEMSASHVIPFSYNSESLSQAYPLLVDVDVRLLRQDYEILRQFNYYFRNNIGLLNLDGSSRTCSNLFQHRDLLFHSVKMNTFYDILERTPSIEGQQPTLTLNRYIS
jgi:hypothetical protein